MNGRRARKLVERLPVRATVAVLLTSVVLLSVSGVGLWRSQHAASDIEPPPSVNYVQTGEFDYVATLLPSTLYGDKPETEPIGGEIEEEAETSSEQKYVFFRDITDDLDFYYTTSFECSEPLARIDTDVTFSVYLANDDLWRIESERCMESHSATGFQIHCPLDIDHMDWEAEEIGKDIGIEARELDVEIVAHVLISAMTTGGCRIDEEYVHTLMGEMQEKTLELSGELDSHSEGSAGDAAYSHHGRFDYEAWLEYNDLYSEQVLRTEPLPVAELEMDNTDPRPTTTVGPDNVLFPYLVESVEGQYRFALEADTELENRRHVVDVAVVVRNADLWEKRFEVVTKNVYSDDFVVTFPLDVRRYIEQVEQVERETGVVSNDYAMNLVADVHTTADCPLGSLDEQFSQVLDGKLMGNTLTFGGARVVQQDGMVGGVEAPEEDAAVPLPLPWLIGVVLGLIGIGASIWLWRIGVSEQVPGTEKVVRAALKRHQQLIAFASAVPPVPEGASVVRMDSLDTLARIARDSAEPLVYVQDGDRHLFLVIKNGTRYEYSPGCGAGS